MEKERNPFFNIVDFVEMFFVAWPEEPIKEQITDEPTQIFTRKQKFNKFKEQAEDVEFEEIQG